MNARGILATIALAAAPGAFLFPKRAAVPAPAPTPLHALRYNDSPDLSPAAREILSDRMETHAFDMNELVWAVVMLDHEETQRLADELTDFPAIQRPLERSATDSDLSAQLPEKFFDLQDGFLRSAKELSRAAATRENDRIARAYGRLTEACVACHSAYLNGDEEGGF